MRKMVPAASPVPPSVAMNPFVTAMSSVVDVKRCQHTTCPRVYESSFVIPRNSVFSYNRGSFRSAVSSFQMRCRVAYRSCGSRDSSASLITRYGLKRWRSPPRSAVYIRMVAASSTSSSYLSYRPASWSCRARARHLCATASASRIPASRAASARPGGT